MLRSYIKIAFRNLWKNRLFSALNIVGMGIGMAAVGLMSLYVIHELSYDRFHANADRIVRVVRDYGMFDRRESPQYYPAIGNETPPHDQ